MPRYSTVAATLGPLLALLALAACASLPVPVLVPALTETQVPSTPCAKCGPTTQIAALTQADINASARQAQATATADILNSQALATSSAGTATQGAALAEADINTIALQAQAAATADIRRAHALATANSASSTQGAALTQDSLNADALQAQAAATAAVVQAEALATANSASSTQSSALTQAALAKTQVQLRLESSAQSATQGSAATGTQQWIGARVAGTATTLARAMMDQTQSAAAIAQQAADLRQAENQGPIVFLWKWGLPLFMAAAAILGLWGLWRWLRLHTSRPRLAGQTAGGPVIIRERRRSLPEYLPNLLRWTAWFIETRSPVPAPDGPPHAVVVIAGPQNPAVDATAPTVLESVPAPDQLTAVSQPFTSGAHEVEVEASPAQATVRLS